MSQLFWYQSISYLYLKLTKVDCIEFYVDNKDWRIFVRENLVMRIANLFDSGFQENGKD